MGFFKGLGSIVVSPITATSNIVKRAVSDDNDFDFLKAISDGIKDTGKDIDNSFSDEDDK